MLSLIHNFFLSAKNNPKPPLLVILGPTCSGKTALSLKIAQKYPSEIISADSRQLYLGMDIGTDKVSLAIRKKIPHHLIDIANPDKTITLFEYKKLAAQAIKKVLKKQKLPILVGGTGLYLSAVTENYKLPKIKLNPLLRRKLLADLKKYGEDYLYLKLKQIDPLAAAKIDKRNHRYLIRALEINLITGKKKLDLKGESPYNTLKIGIIWPRLILYQKIDDRVDAQIKTGLIEETRMLLQKYDENNPALSSLGYRQIAKHLKGEITLDQAKELLKKETRNYAKRQLTWFRRDKEIIWLNGEEIKA